MSSRTRIVVLHMKELIYTVIFVVLGILLVLLLLFMFKPGAAETQETMRYVAGVYTSSISFNDKTVDVEVIVDSDHINSIELVNLDETVTTMYPLMEPAMENLCKQICRNQTTENISYDDDNQYTSMVLLGAVKEALAKAEVTE